MAGSASNSTTVGVNIQLGVNGAASVTQATQSVQQLNQQIAQTGQQNVAAPMQSLRQALREATAEAGRLALQGQQNTQAYADAARRVAEIRDQIGELNTTISSFDPDNKIKVFANAAASATRVIGGLTGAMTVLGIENKSVQENLLKLQAISAISDGINGIADLGDSFKDLGRIIGLTTTSTVAQSAANTANATTSTASATATGANAVAQNANATATVGATTATNAATTSTNRFGIALKAIGIGIFIAALVALYENWDSVKKAIDRVFPSLGGVDKLFTDVTNRLVGFGHAVSKLLTFDGKSFADNIKEGITDRVKQQSEDIKNKLIKDQIETNERTIKIQKARGNDTTKLEVDTQKLRIQTLDKDSKDYKKLKADAETELTVIQATAQKKREDDAEKAAKKHSKNLDTTQKSDLSTIKRNNEEALKVIAEGSQNQRNLELTDIDVKYKKEFALLEKRKKDVKDYNSEFANLTNARKNEEAKVNKKYDDQISDYLKSVQIGVISNYDKTIDEINKKIDDELKHASPEQAKALEASRTVQIEYQNKLRSADSNSKQANSDLLDSEDSNRANNKNNKDLGTKKDTIEQAIAKVNAIEQAKLSAENAAFALKKLQLQGQNDELAELEANHQKNIGDINAAASDSRVELATKEKEARINTMDAIGNAANTLGQIAGEQTAVGKGLSVAGATISTYEGANKALAQGGIFGAISAAGIITAGLLNVKKILSTKIPGGKSSSSTSGMPSAPVINSTVLQSATNGSANIADAVKNQTQTPIRAYIVSKDLDKQASKNNVINNLSTY